MSIERGWEDADQEQEQNATTWFPEAIPVKITETLTENVAPEATSWNSYSIAQAPQLAGTGGTQPTQLCPHRYHRYKAKFIFNIPAATTVYIARVPDYLMSGAFGNAFALTTGQNLPDYDGQQAMYAIYTGTGPVTVSVMDEGFKEVQ
jgi:hypothetical protein